MRLSITATPFLVAHVAVKTCVGFQVDTQTQKLYKDAVEKATTKKLDLPPITVADDHSYAPPDDDFYEYWFDNRIHVFGNTGILGGLHAFVAPFATKAIDDAAYKGESVRTLTSSYLSEQLGKKKKNARILDLCCGVGISTRALQEAFPDADAIVGLDTSPEMISMAKFLTNHINYAKAFMSNTRDNVRSLLSLLSDKSELFRNPSNRCEPAYARGNAEKTIFHDESFDLVTIMYGFHEIPRLARGRILRESRRILQDGGTLAVIDISTDYNPSETMLAGEPYVLEYKKNIHKQMQSFVGFTNYRYETIVPGHVGMWLLTRDKRNQVPSHTWSI